MKRKQKRTHIIGALIFLALIAILGFGLIATGNFHNPIDFLMGGQHQGGQRESTSQPTDNNGGVGPASDHAGPPTSNNGDIGPTADHAGPPGGDDSNGIAWNQIGGVFSDLWILSAIAACYILVQQILELIANHFWDRKYSHPST